MRTLAQALMMVVAFMIVAILNGGCTYGMTVEKLKVAREPAGATVHITTDVRQLSGELIEVRDAGLLVMDARVVRLIPYTAIASAQIEQTKLTINGHQAPTRDRREKVRLLSRYPQGLPPALLQDLLRAYGQEAPAGIDR